MLVPSSTMMSFPASTVSRPLEAPGGRAGRFMRPPLKVMSPVACSRMFVWPAKPENEVIVRSSPKTVDEAAVIRQRSR